MDLTIIIVSWNVRDRLRECLRSIFETAVGGSLSVEVFVVDNASKDQSAEMVRAEFPQVRVIANAENFGFARANNQAIRLALRVHPPTPPLPQGGGETKKGFSPSFREGERVSAEALAKAGEGVGRSRPEFILLLNPDMRVMPGTLEGLVAFMREPRNARVGIAGCHLVDSNGKIVPHVRRFPRLPDQLAILTKTARMYPHALDRYLVTDFDYAREARVDSIRGSFFCIRRKLMEQIGFLDERFFIWFEEVDFCMRARQAGWQVAYTPSVQCVDYVGQSFKQVRFYPKQRMFTESMLKYFRKHRPAWEWATLAVVRPAVLGAAWVHDKVRSHRKSPKNPVATLTFVPPPRRFEGRGGVGGEEVAWRNRAHLSLPHPPSPLSRAEREGIKGPKLLAQLVSWNGTKYIPYLFASLRAQTLQDWELIVIDNGSTDGTIAAIERALEDFSQFRAKLRKEFRYQFIRNAENRGFAGGHNQAFEAASSQLPAASAPKYVQLLNQDTVLAPEYFERLVGFMERTPTCAAAQGALLRWDFSRAGEPDGGRTDTIDTLGLRVLRSRRVVELGTGEQLDDVLRVSGNPSQPPLTLRGGDEAVPPLGARGGEGELEVARNPSQPPLTLRGGGPFEVFGVSGALPMYRMAALRDVALPQPSAVSTPPLGARGGEGELRVARNPSQPPLTVRGGEEIFDEDFFSYKEDVDLAFRLRSAGWSAYVVPSTRAWHDRTAAGPRELTDAAAVDLRRSKSPLVRYHSYKNHLLTLVKNEHPINFARHWPWVVGYELRKLAYVLLRERDTLRALREVWQRLPAMRAKRRAIMAKWKMKPAEVRKWFR